MYVCVCMCACARSSDHSGSTGRNSSRPPSLIELSRDVTYVKGEKSIEMQECALIFRPDFNLQLYAALVAWCFLWGIEAG